MASVTARPVSPDSPRPLKGARGISGNGDAPESPNRGISGSFGIGETRATKGSHLWRITLPNRPSFDAWCIQKATADEMRAVWPAADIEAVSP